jgi:hypothetical protein
MKKVNLLLMTIMMFFSLENLFRNLRTPKAVNHESSEGKNNINFVDSIGRKTDDYRYFDYILSQIKWVFGGRDRTGKIIMLPILPNANPSILACIHAGTKKADKEACAENIQTLGASTTYLTIPPLLLSDLTPMILVLHNAHGDNAIGSAWFKINKQLTKIMLLVQDVMDANVPDSITICEHYGFTVHGKGGSHPQIFEGFPGDVTGTADFLAKVGPQGCCYDWKLWNDARTTFVRLRPTTVAHCTIAGQPSGTNLNVSNDIIYGETVLEESQIIQVPTK